MSSTRVSFTTSKLLLQYKVVFMLAADVGTRTGLLLKSQTVFSKQISVITDIKLYVSRAVEFNADSFSL